ncbi:hypothetical protein LTR50_006308 [Elasticomyces elasticus]|nr:hypothetical protein LTR50_006308 [Elasticomyces elasticus]
MAESQKPQVHVDPQSGSDEAPADGSKQHPYKTLGYAYFQHKEGAEYHVLGEDESDKDGPSYKPAAKAGLKKAAKLAQGLEKKAKGQEELALRQKQEEESRSKALEESKKIVVTEDSSLPKAVKIKLSEKDPKVIRLRSGDSKKDVDYSEGRGSRVRVAGWVHRVRDQKAVIFVELRDGYGFLQCVLTGQLAKTYDALTLTRETFMEITGEMWEVPPGAHAPDDRELHADYFKVIGKAPGGEEAITNKVQAQGDAQTLLDQRHLVMRGEVASAVMRVRAAVESAFAQTYREVDCCKVSPPALVQTQVEGGATLFKFDYYGEQSFLTQSSQLYLETVLPSLGDVYCIEKSFRAEKSLTRRHLSEYTHIEAELNNITFDELLVHLEQVMCRVLEITLSDPRIAGLIQKLHPEFKQPERPFKRMKYADAIEWLREHDIPNEEGEPHSFGDDIAEAAERKMTDIIDRPIFLTHFPVEIKAFYMAKDVDDPRVTESVDCLMPGVGEIVGGSMRMWDYDELMAAYEREGIDPKPYYWYTDQRL